MAGPLTGIKVLEFGQEIQGPYAAMMLSFMGAQVVKIERREGGDASRRAGLRWGPELKGVSPYFLALNRGKRSITLDLKQPVAQDVVKRLVAESDVVVSNWRLGVLDRVGLGYEHLKRVNPRSIYAQGSGFGPRGPRATRPARDVLGQAISGIMSVTGMPDDPPLPAGTLIGDQGSAIQLAMGVLAALVHRERTGQGQRVDVSIYGALLGLQTWEVTQYALTKRLKRAGRTHVFVGGAWGSFKTKDGYLCLAGIGEDRWPRFTRIVPGLDEDPRFTTLELRQKNEPELIAHLDRAFPQRSTAEWLQDLEAADILCAPVHTYDDVLADEQSNANGYVQTMQHPLLGEIKAVGPVIGLSETPLAVQGSEPELGAHTEEILLELGYTWQQIEQLRNCQAI